jgi:hypothetical protein
MPDDQAATPAHPEVFAPRKFSVDLGPRWICTPETVQPDITAYELSQILGLRLSVYETFFTAEWMAPNVLRHFRREG